MIRRCTPVLTLSIALACALRPADTPLETIHAGNYSEAAFPQPSARILNWNIDRGKHFQGILAAIRETRPDLCVFQEVDLGARRAGGPAAYHGQAILTTLPIFQRRLGGRLALVNELDRGGQLVVVYNLHLESRTSEEGRLLQLEEVLHDAERYPASTPVIMAGDLNTPLPCDSAATGRRISFRAQPGGLRRRPGASAFPRFRPFPHLSGSEVLAACESA